jgi:hypothetical protein
VLKKWKSAELLSIVDHRVEAGSGVILIDGVCMLDARDVDGEIELTGELTAERTGVAPAGARRAA